VAEGAETAKSFLFVGTPLQTPRLHSPLRNSASGSAAFQKSDTLKMPFSIFPNESNGYIKSRSSGYCS
jgi:hypothetical protein